VINLNTTGDGLALYRSLGFTEPRYPALGISPAEAFGCLGPQHIAGQRVGAEQR
jgi:hypothetical protein